MENYHLREQERLSSVKNQNWGIPQLQQFPLEDAKQVKLAEAHFCFCPPEYKIQLAYNIVSRARKLGVNINNTEVLEWASRWY